MKAVPAGDRRRVPVRTDPARRRANNLSWANLVCSGSGLDRFDGRRTLSGRGVGGGGCPETRALVPPSEASATTEAITARS